MRCVSSPSEWLSPPRDRRSRWRSETSCPVELVDVGVFINDVVGSTPSTTSSAASSGVAPLGDYTYLLLQASDVGPDVATTGPPMQNPGGVAGAAVTFGNPDRMRTIDDLVVVFTDPTVAAQQAKDRAQSFGKYVTAAPNRSRWGRTD